MSGPIEIDLMSIKVHQDRLREMKFLRLPIEKILDMILHRWRHYVDNVDRTGLELPQAIPTDQREILLARIRSSDGSEVFLTNTRIICDLNTIILYNNIFKIYWLAESLPSDFAELQRIKAEQFDRIIVEGSDGSTIVLNRLGQSVFPLLRFLEWQQLRIEAERQGVL